MLMLFAIIGFLLSLILRLLHGHTARSSRLHHPRKPLRSSKRSQHCHSKPKPEWLKHEILRLKALMPQAGCRTIAGICNRRYAASRNITVGKTYVHQILQRNDYDIQILRRKLKHAKPKPLPRNLVWGVDLTGKTDASGSLHFLFGILDHGSRALLYLQALRNKTSHTLIACISEVIRTHDKPKIIRTDSGRVAAQQRGTHRHTPCGCNEGMFRSAAFGNALKQLGIRHQRTTPGCPWQNGRIERLFGTLKQKLDQWQVAGIAQLNCDLDTFRYWYNHIRPHQNLDSRTPAEVWCGINPYTKSPKQEYWFEAWDGLLSGYHLRY